MIKTMKEDCVSFETKTKCESVDVFIERLWEYIEDNYYRL